MMKLLFHVISDVKPSTIHVPSTSELTTVRPHNHTTTATASALSLSDQRFAEKNSNELIAVWPNLSSLHQLGIYLYNVSS